jgi:PKD repeat protein
VSGSTVTVGGTAAAGTAGTTITRIAWDWGDTTTEDHAVPNTHAYAATGTYTVTVTAYQSDGQSTSRTVRVPINGPTVTTTVPTTTTPPPATAPAAAFNWSASATNGRDIRFTDASTGIITAWSWQFGDDATAVGQTAGHVYAQAGNYTVTLTVTGPGGASTATREIRIGDTATPYVTPTPTSTTVPATVTEITVGPTVTDRQPPPDFPWWIAAIAAVGLLAGGVAVARVMGRQPPAPEERVPSMTIEARGGLRRPSSTGPPRRREAEVEIEVRGGMRRDR